MLDSDDIWVENKLERQFYFIEKIKGICFLGATFPLCVLGKSKEGLYKLNARELCYRNMPSTPSVVFKKEIGIELGLFDEKMRYGEDINFFQKFLLKDSYYIMAESLIKLGIGKSFYGESGLSSNFILMHKGRNENVRDLHKLGLIGKPFMYCMLVMNEIKLIRRIIMRLISRAVNSLKKTSKY